MQMKKILSIFLVALMCISTFPVSVFAADEVAMPTCPTCLDNTNVSATKVNADATCTEAAGEWFKCSKKHADNTPQEFFKPYGEGFYPDKAEVAHHSSTDHVTPVAKQDSTCVDEGNEAYWFCDVCKVYYQTKDMEAGKAFKDEAATVIPVKTKHTYNEGIFTWKDGIEPECGVRGGTKVFACQIPGCTATAEEEVKAIDHEWKYLSHEEIGDCLTIVDVTEKCELCGDTRVVDGYGWNHSLVKTDAIAKKCDAAGQEAYWTCEHCDRFFMEISAAEFGTDDIQILDNGKVVYAEEVEENAWIVPASHEPVKMGGDSATCLTAGSNVYYDCAECDKFFSDEACTTEIEANSWIIPANGHIVTLVAANDATCTEAGNSAYYDCTACDLYFAAAEEGDALYTAGKVLFENAEIEVKEVAKDSWVIDPTGHTFGATVNAVNGNCTTQGNVEYKTCSACNNNFAPDAANDSTAYLSTIYVTPMVPNPDFDAVDYAINGASDENPFFVEAGSVEGALNITEQHNWVHRLDKKPTCYMTGVVSWHCADCDAYTSELLTYVIDATEHSAIDTTVADWYVPEKPATCIATGTRAHVQCPDCEYYLLVDVAEDGTATIAYEKGEWDDTDATIFVLPIDSENHADSFFAMLMPGRTATCEEFGYNDYYWCLLCAEFYQIVDGEMQNIPKIELGLNADGDMEYVIDFTAIAGYDVHTATYYADKEATFCGDSYYDAYYACDCGLYYGVKDNDGEPAVDYTNSLGNVAPISYREHDYQAVDATFDCGNDGLMAHYICKNDNCDKYFLYVAILNAYVEVTKDKLAVEATAQHDYKEVKAAILCVEGVDGVAGKEKCSVCGDERVINPHTYTDRDYLTVPGTNEATCEEVGHYALKCKYCQTYKRTDDGQSIAIYEAPRKAHTDYGSVFFPANDPTCFEDGNKAYYLCNGCGKKFPTIEMLHSDAFDIVYGDADTSVEVEDGKVNVSLSKPVTETYKQGWEVIPAEHKGVIDFVPAADALGCGFTFDTQKYCTICEKYSKDNFATYQDTPYTTDNPDHHHGKLVAQGDDEEATCLADGHKMTYKCDNADCGKVYIFENNAYVLATAENVVIETLSHNGTFKAYVAPTCTATGNYAYYTKCTNGCDKVYFAIDKEATEVSAMDLQNISVENNYVIPALGHVQTEANTVAAHDAHCIDYYTVDPGNIAYYTCDVCNKRFADGDTKADAVALTNVTIEAPEHMPADTLCDSLATTCTKDGYDAYECTCGYVSYWFVAPLGHNVADENKNTTKIEPTCSNTGMQEFYFCSNCKTSYKDADCTEIWKSYAELTLDEAIKEAKKDAVIDATQKHVNIDENGVKTEIIAGCYNGEFVLGEDGKWYEPEVDRVCDECGTDFTNSHSWTPGHVNTSCSYPESDYDICEVCHVINENTRVVIGEKDPTAHVAAKDMIQMTTPNTKCTDANRFYNVCPLCEQQVGNAYADPNGHDYQEQSRDNGTCGTNGVSHQKCSKCGDNKDVTIPSPATHKFTGAWTLVDGYNYKSDKAEVRSCDYGCGATEYRAHQDVFFDLDLDSAIREGAVLVNSGRLAVTVKLSAYNKSARAFKFSFSISDALTLDVAATEWHALAGKFSTQLSGVSMDANDPTRVNIIVARMVGEVALDADETDDVVYIEDEALVTLYFDIADDATAINVSNIRVVEMQDAKGAVDVSAFRKAANKTEKVATLGDGNVVSDNVIGDGAIDFSDLYQVIDLIMNNTDGTYIAQLDFDKDGDHTAADLNALKAYVLNGDYNALIHPAA